MKIRIYFFLSLLFFCIACGKKKDENTNELSWNEEMKLTQYIRQGERLYVQHCANCHQEDGSGLGRLIPPLKDSDYMTENVERTICIIKNGMKGEIIVNGVQYNQPMPAMTQLKAIDIAEIATYIHSTWGKHKEIVEVKVVQKLKCE